VWLWRADLANGTGLELGLVYLGQNATQRILDLHARNHSFLFFYFTPSRLIQTHDFVRVQLPQHQWREWDDNSSQTPQGPIASDFIATPPLKLGNANTMDLFPHLAQFLRMFSLHEMHADELLQLTSTHCGGVDSLHECAALHSDVGCEWLINNTFVWEDFIPDHAHCSIGEHVVKQGRCSEFTDTNNATGIAGAGCTVFCEQCVAGQFNPRGTYQSNCTDCPAGSYMADRGAAYCTLCPVGRANPLTGSTSVDACRPCAVGTFQRDEGGVQCDVCEPGSYQDVGGRSYCTNCPTGRYQGTAGATTCQDCPATARACRVERVGEKLKKVCPSEETSVAACTCSAGHYLGVSGLCLPCPDGAHCCMCPEVAGCYDPAYGPCDIGLLHHNMETYNSTCSTPDMRSAATPELVTADKEPWCVSGVTRPLPMYGYFRIDPPLLPGSSAADARLESRQALNQPTTAPDCCFTMLNVSGLLSGDGGNGSVALAPWAGAPDAEFGACNLRLPTVAMRTKLNASLQGCRGGPDNECAAHSSGYLCRTCEAGYYIGMTGKCYECDDVEGGATVQYITLTVACLVIVPLAYTFFYFSVSDKSASQMMVYPRLMIDLCTVFYLLYSSMFKYWPYELLNHEVKVGRSKAMDANIFFVECSFGWGFVARYNFYLSLPIVLMCSVGLCFGLMWFVKTFNDTEERPSEHELGSYPVEGSDERGDRPFARRMEENWFWRAGEVKYRGYGSALRSVARAMAGCMPSASGTRGSRIAWAPPCGGPREKEKIWRAYKDHTFQVALLWATMIFITVVNYSLTVYDCSSSNDVVTSRAQPPVRRPLRPFRRPF
jgi:hypothetical protein